MKKTGMIIWISMLSAVFIVTTAFNSIQTKQKTKSGPEEGFSIPKDVNQIIESSCFGCHNSESQSEKGKKKLMFDHLGELSKAKLVGKLGEISEVVEKSEMPPEKFLAKYPDKALNDKEAGTLKAWADSAADELLK